MRTAGSTPASLRISIAFPALVKRISKACRHASASFAPRALRLPERRRRAREEEKQFRIVLHIERSKTPRARPAARSRHQGGGRRAEDAFDASIFPLRRA